MPGGNVNEDRVIVSVLRNIFTSLESSFVSVLVFHLPDTRLNLQNFSLVSTPTWLAALCRRSASVSYNRETPGIQETPEERACWSSFRGHVDKAALLWLKPAVQQFLRLANVKDPHVFRFTGWLQCGLVTRMQCQSPYSQGCDLSSHRCGWQWSTQSYVGSHVAWLAHSRHWKCELLNRSTENEALDCLWPGPGSTRPTYAPLLSPCVSFLICKVGLRYQHLAHCEHPVNVIK